jgi:hypothetical protein
MRLKESIAPANGGIGRFDFSRDASQVFFFKGGA